jgi:hypothetical protein
MYMYWDSNGEDTYKDTLNMYKSKISISQMKPRIIHKLNIFTTKGQNAKWFLTTFILLQ